MKNLKLYHANPGFVLRGNSSDVDVADQQAARKARSATEGFIAVAKTWRGFGRSLYRGLQGATRCTWLNLGISLYQNNKF